MKENIKKTKKEEIDLELQKRKKQKLKESGITLIALVVTIIILLILVGVTISQISGENGLFQRAREAVERYKNASEQEQIQLGQLEQNNSIEIKNTIFSDLRGIYRGDNTSSTMTFEKDYDSVILVATCGRTSSYNPQVPEVFYNEKKIIDNNAENVYYFTNTGSATNGSKVSLCVVVIGNVKKEETLKCSVDGQWSVFGIENSKNVNILDYFKKMELLEMKSANNSSIEESGMYKFLFIVVTAGGGDLYSIAQTDIKKNGKGLFWNGWEDGYFFSTVTTGSGGSSGMTFLVAENFDPRGELTTTGNCIAYVWGIK